MSKLWEKRIATKQYPASVRGLMLCGINWGDGGGGSQFEGLREEPSFFSDIKSKNASYPFQKTLREWFKLWGHNLNTEASGPLERAISHTNWIAEGSVNAEAIYTRANLLKFAEPQFFPVLGAVRPRLLLFLGLQLAETFKDRSLLKNAEKVLGPLKSEYKEEWYQRHGGGRRFRATTMEFKDCFVLGLPHPTPPSGALSHADAAQFREVFEKALNTSGILTDC